MKHVLVLILTMIIFSANAQQANFSGKWKLNVEQSKFGALDESTSPAELTISINSDSVIIERFSKAESNESKNYTERLSLNGKPCVTVRSYDGVKKVTTATIGSDKILIAKGNYYPSAVSEQSTHTLIENWTLSADEKTLTNAIDISIGGQNDHVTLVYNRK